MKIYSFFRLLNFKIKQYEKSASDAIKKDMRPITIIWVEDPPDIPFRKNL